MRKTRDGRRRFSREFKIAAVRRVLEGEALGEVARDLGVTFSLLWGWKKRVAKKGEEHLYELGRPKQWAHSEEKKPTEASQQRRIAELERELGRQQMEIRFLDRALRRVEEQRRRKKVGGGEASSKE